jgi:hypothetical protein
LWRIVTPKGVKMGRKPAAAAATPPAEEVVRDIRRAVQLAAAIPGADPSHGRTALERISHGWNRFGASGAALNCDS